MAQYELIGQSIPRLFVVAEKSKPQPCPCRSYGPTFLDSISASLMSPRDRIGFVTMLLVN